MPHKSHQFTVCLPYIHSVDLQFMVNNALDIVLLLSQHKRTRKLEKDNHKHNKMAIIFTRLQTQESAIHTYIS